MKKDIIAELYAPARRNFKRRKVEIKSLNDSFQADLVDLKKYSRQNKGYTLLLTCINVFTKFAWVEPLKNKSAKEVTKAMGRILDKTTSPRLICVDEGLEFFNKDFNSLMQKYKIKLYHTFSPLKSSIIERYNRTLKTKMWKIFAIRGNFKYYDILNDLVNEYNSTVHRTINMKPKDVGKKHERMLQQTVFKNERSNKRDSKLKINDYVRISKYKKLFEKGYTQNWTDEIFKINKIHLTKPITYSLQDYEGKNIEGRFYKEEIKKTKYPHNYLVEKILRKKGDQYLVKWRGFSNEHNSYISKNEILT